MLNWIIGRKIAAFERAYDYDMAYARELLAIDRAAVMAINGVQGLGNYCKDVPRDVYFAAKLTGTLLEDCGPCTQLGVTMGLKAGIPASAIASVLRGDVTQMRPELALGVQFARAVTAHAPEADELRAEIARRWGKRAVVSLAFAVVTARIYPTLKYALGHGQTCQRVVVEGQAITPPAVATASYARGA